MLWIYLIGVVIGFIYFVSKTASDKDTPQELIRIAAMLVIWPLALTFYLAVKLYDHFKPKNI